VCIYVCLVALFPIMQTQVYHITLRLGRSKLHLPSRRFHRGVAAVATSTSNAGMGSSFVASTARPVQQLGNWKVFMHMRIRGCIGKEQDKSQGARWGEGGGGRDRS
jgi:hypothetical protein